MRKFLGFDNFTKPTSEIISLSQELQGKAERQTIENILKYLKNNLRNVKLEEESPEEWRKLFKKRTAGEILATKTSYGCSDTTVLFVTLARASGIPTKFIEGKRIGKAGGHCWAEALIEGDWVAIDPVGGLIGFDPEKVFHGPYLVLSRSLGPSDGAILSYKDWLEIEQRN